MNRKFNPFAPLMAQVMAHPYMGKFSAGVEVNEAKEQEILRLRRAGTAIFTIARKMHCGERTVYRILEKHNVSADDDDDTD